MRRWYENLANGSQETANVQLRHLWCFCDAMNVSPTHLVEVGRLGDSGLSKVEDLLQDFVTKFQRTGKKGSYIKGVHKAVKSWLSFNHLRLWRKIKVRGSTGQYKGPVPDPAELIEIIEKSSLRGKVSICLMAYSALRPEVLGSGTDGLKLGDLPDVRLAENQLDFIKIPGRIRVRKELSKTENEYISFYPERTSRYLKSYVEERIMDGEQITSDSAIISVQQGRELAGFRKSRSNRHVTSKAISTEIRRAMRPKFTFRPYDLRSYFETYSLKAESRYKLVRDFRVFMMGHKGDIEATYSLNRGQLPEDLIDEIQATYTKYLEFLDPQILQVRAEGIAKVSQLETDNKELRLRVRAVERSEEISQDLEERVSMMEDLLERIGADAFLKRGFELSATRREQEAQEMQDLREEITRRKRRSQQRD